MPVTTERIQEYASSAGVTLRVDREKCMVYGVKVLGLHSKNDGGKREYSPKALAEAVGKYENAPVFVDHGTAGKSRSYYDRNGRLVNARVTPDGIFADHAYNSKHPATEQYLEDAEQAPGNVGFSHDIDGVVTRKDGKVIVESITAVHSCDLVARAATTATLFESEELPEDPAQRELCEHGLSACSDARSILLGNEPIETKKARVQEVLSVWQAELTGVPVPHKEPTTMDWKDITIESLKEHCGDLVAKLTGTDEISKLTGEVKTLKESVAAKDAELAAIRAKEAEQAKTLAIAEELKAAKLDASDKTACSDVLMEQLRAAPDAAARKRLIEDRVAVLKTAVKQTIITGNPFVPVTSDKQAEDKPATDSFSSLLDQ